MAKLFGNTTTRNKENKKITHYTEENTRKDLSEISEEYEIITY